MVSSVFQLGLVELPSRLAGNWLQLLGLSVGLRCSLIATFQWILNGASEPVF